jgi:hypothetical protein
MMSTDYFLLLVKVNEKKIVGKPTEILSIAAG